MEGIKITVEIKISKRKMDVNATHSESISARECAFHPLLLACWCCLIISNLLDNVFGSFSRFAKIKIKKGGGNNGCNPERAGRLAIEAPAEFNRILL